MTNQLRRVKVVTATPLTIRETSTSAALPARVANPGYTPADGDYALAAFVGGVYYVLGPA